MSELAFTILGTNNHEQAFAFYDTVLKTIGIEPSYTINKLRYYGRTWENGGPIFGVSKPINRQPATIGNGTMVAFRVDAEALVDAMHATAISAGGACAGPPSVIRDNDRYRFYCAYFLDPEGNKVEVFCAVCRPSGHVVAPYGAGGKIVPQADLVG